MACAYSFDLNCGPWSDNIEVFEEKLPGRSSEDIEKIKNNLMYLYQLQTNNKNTYNNVSYSYDSAWDSVPFTAFEDSLDWDTPSDLVNTLLGDAKLDSEQRKEMTSLISEICGTLPLDPQT